MPDTFNTTRTPGSRSSAYDLVAHIAESNPHPQYLLKSDYQGGGSGSLDLEIHKLDPNAHGDNYVKPVALNNYYTKAEINANFYTKTQVDELLRGIDGSGVTLYHDPVNDDSEAHAASMKAANVVYNFFTDLDARVGVLEQNAIMFTRHDFIASQWNDNSDGTFTYTFNTNHFTSSHIYMNETGGSVLVDESVEVHIEGPTETDASSRKVRLVSPQAFSGYIITLG